jgi:hypothetical protein
MQEIGLTKGYITKVSEADYLDLIRFKWCAKVCRCGVYAVRKARPAERAIYGTQVFLHRFLAQAPAGQDVIHLNGDPLDNRRENLEILDKAVNAATRWTRRQARMSGPAGGDHH